MVSLVQALGDGARTKTGLKRSLDPIVDGATASTLGDGARTKTGLKHLRPMHCPTPQTARRRCPDQDGIETRWVSARLSLRCSPLGDGARTKTGLKLYGFWPWQRFRPARRRCPDQDGIETLAMADVDRVHVALGDGARTKTGLKHQRPDHGVHDFDWLGDGARTKTGVKRWDRVAQPGEFRVAQRRCPDQDGIGSNAAGLAAPPLFLREGSARGGMWPPTVWGWSRHSLSRP